MQRGLWALLILTASLAGCLGADPDPSGDQAPPVDATASPRDVVPWDLVDCTALVWFVPADAGAVAARLPDGFTPRGVIGLPGAQAPPGADAYLGFEAFTCASGQGLDGAVEGMTYATVFTSVVPPEDLAVEGVDGQHYYKWHVLVPDPPRRGVLQGAGLPVADGSVTVEETAPGVWSATATLDGLGTFSLQGPADGEPQPSGGAIPFAEFTAADGGVATWRATASDIARASGAGTWTVPEGSWMADVLGATTGSAAFDLDRWSFVDATITLPAS